MSSFVLALTYPLRGVEYFLRRPKLWKYAILSVSLNLAVFVAGAVLFWHYRGALIGGLVPSRTPSWLRATLGWVLTGGMFAAGLFLFTIAGNLLATPFLDALTERILLDLGESLPPARGPLRALGRALVNQTAKLLIFGAIQGALLLLWVTPLGLLHPPLSGFLTVLFLGFEYLDYPLDARRIPVPARFAWLVRHCGAALGFGVVLFFVLWVPLLGYLCLPLSVSGATLLAHRIDSSDFSG